MCGIETNAKSFRLSHTADDVGEMFEFLSETGTLASCRFERDARFNFWQAGKNLVNRRDNFFEARFFSGAEMRAGMQHDERNLKLIGAYQFFRQCAQ